MNKKLSFLIALELIILIAALSVLVTKIQTHSGIPNHPGECSDSDAGLNPSEKGKTTSMLKNKKLHAWTDQCLNINQLAEGYCDSRSPTGKKTKVINCKKEGFRSCQNGACVK